jgi:hypothetical protein
LTQFFQVSRMNGLGQSCELCSANGAQGEQVSARCLPSHWEVAAAGKSCSTHRLGGNLQETLATANEADDLVRAFALKPPLRGVLIGASPPRRVRLRSLRNKFLKGILT